MIAVWHQLITQLPWEWAQFGFMRLALLAVLLLTPVFALLGCLVVNNQMAFFSEAIGHAALTGIALGVLAGLGNPLWAMILFALLLALGVTALRRWSAVSTDTVISLVMAFCVALGVVLLSRGGGFAKYSHYLIGDLLAVSPGEVAGLAVLLLGVLLTWVWLFNGWFLASLNRAVARSRGFPVWGLEAVFAAVVAVAVTVSIPWVGVLVVNSLLILPAATARNLARDLRQYLALALLAGWAAGLAGLLASYYWNTAAGGTIVLFAMGLFLLSLLMRRR
ncbi:MAG: metal ABC transporter permease [Lentisphaeria bacterium]